MVSPERQSCLYGEIDARTDHGYSRPFKIDYICNRVSLIFASTLIRTHTNRRDEDLELTLIRKNTVGMSSGLFILVLLLLISCGGDGDG